MDKQEIRERFLDKRLTLTEDEIHQKSMDICRRVIESGLLLGRNRVCAYLAIKNEVGTENIINHLIETGTEVYLPKFVNGGYELVEFGSWDDLETGPYDIRQPKSNKTVDAGQIDVAFLPGVAFDKKGIRLGYGRGVFDRLFANSSAILVGLAYKFQVVDDLPREDHDLVMDFVVTEDKIIRTKIYSAMRSQ